MRNGIECSTHCHNSKMCCNKRNDRDSDEGMAITVHHSLASYGNQIVAIV